MASSPNPRAGGWEIPIDRSTSVMMEKGARRNVLFVRRLKPWPKADVRKDYVRVWVYDVEGTLRTTVANSPKIDRAALEDAVSAMTHGRTRVAPIADAVMLAAADPRAYIEQNKEACADYAVFEPTLGLHVIALLQHLPEDLLVYFDWKEAMEEVAPMLARMLRKGPRVAVAPKPKPLKDMARAIAKKGVILAELGTESDAYSIVCVRREDAKRIATWRRKAHLPLKPLAT